MKLWSNGESGDEQQRDQQLQQALDVAPVAVDKVSRGFHSFRVPNIVESMLNFCIAIGNDLQLDLSFAFF